jgi:hypothetical protein
MMDQRWSVVRCAARRVGFPVALLGLLLGCVPGCGSGDDDDDDSSKPSAGSDGAGSGGGDAGKGGAGSGAGSGGAATAGSAGQTGQRKSPAILVGSFTLKLDAERAPTPLDPDGSDAVASVLGVLGDAPTPLQKQHVTTEELGECRLLVPNIPNCSTNCVTMNAVCTADDVCTPKPTPYGVGIVHLTAGSAETDLEYEAKNYQLSADVKLPYPPCKEGEPVTIEAEGGEFEPFSIETRCIGELEVGGPFALEPGKPVKLAWSAPQDDELAFIHIRLNISHHGGDRGELQCDVPDTGAYEIPASLVDKLLDLGVAGFPTIQLTRTVVAHAEGEPAKVTLEVKMLVEREVTIPGLVSCASDSSACPAGQECQTDLTCK